VQRSILCDPYAVEMRSHAQLPSAEFTLLSRSGPTSRTLNSERLLWAEFFCHAKPPRTKGSSIDQFRGSLSGRVYALLTTDMGRFCRKALMSALFICKPPL